MTTDRKYVGRFCCELRGQANGVLASIPYLERPRTRIETEAMRDMVATIKEARALALKAQIQIEELLAPRPKSTPK